MTAVLNPYRQWQAVRNPIVLKPSLDSAPASCLCNGADSRPARGCDDEEPQNLRAARMLSWAFEAATRHRPSLETLHREMRIQPGTVEFRLDAELLFRTISRR